MCAQESMGSPHNLFGTPTVVHVRTAPSSTSVARSSSTVKADVTKNNRSGSGTFMEVNHVITAVVPGQNIEDVIALGRHDGQTMAQALGVDIDRALADGCLNPQQAERLLQVVLARLREGWNQISAHYLGLGSVLLCDARWKYNNGVAKL